ncbi:MAG: hypothetical protein IJ809_05630 [Clostridia bacterium]|nr:hypothetical protein [Clostridia bacterium]
MGIDESEVKKFTDERIPKSISKGETFSVDTHDISTLEKKIRALTNYVVNELRTKKMLARNVEITIKSSDFKTVVRQQKINKTSSYQEILKAVLKIFEDNYKGNYDVRMTAVQVGDLTKESEETQISLFDIESGALENKKNDINQIIDNINKKYGKDIIGYSKV